MKIVRCGMSSMITQLQATAGNAPDSDMRRHFMHHLLAVHARLALVRSATLQEMIEMAHVCKYIVDALIKIRK
jgi:hypothetical protein